MEWQYQLDVSGTDRRVKQLIDRGLPFQLDGLVLPHRSTIYMRHGRSESQDTV